jgi:hypothetical protein
MKLSKYLLAIAAVTVGLTLSAKADLSFVGSAPFTSNNNPDSNLALLGQFVDTTGFTLCGNFENLNEESNLTVDVMPGSFIVIHFGKGGGSTKGGGFEIYQVINGETSVTLPASGTNAFGQGGISSAREFCPPSTNVPDSGTTAMLLGSALTGLGLVRRYLKR